jgi:hypothetical protein
MANEVNSQIIKLLELHHSDMVVRGCLESLAEANEVRASDAEGILPLDQAIDIYSTRAKINANLNGGIIKGYDTLLPALENANVSGVKLTSLELLDRWIVIFTDEAISHLFGVLNCPKRKAAWFHPETGYD